MTVKEAAAELGVSLSMIYKLMRQREIAYLVVGRRKFPLAESVAEYRARNTVRPSAPVATVPSVARPRFKHLRL